MAIYRAKRDKNFTVLSNDLIQNSQITFRARGLLEYMLSMPDDWKFYKSELVKHSPKEGPDAIETSFKELEAAGYMRRIQKRDENGRFSSQDWLVADTPTFSPQGDLPAPASPEPDKPVTANPPLQRTNSTKNLYNKELNLSSSAKSDEEEQEKQSIINEFKRIARTNDDFNGVTTKPTVREWSAIESLSKRLTLSSLQTVLINFKSAMHGYVEKPYPYLLKCMREQLADQKVEGKNG